MNNTESRFIDCGFMRVAPNKRSVNIIIEDPVLSLNCIYHVDLAEYEEVLRHPDFSAKIQKKIEVKGVNE